MDIEKSVCAATYRCAADFTKAVQAEAKRLTKEEDVVPVWALEEAMPALIPSFVERTLVMALTDVVAELRSELNR